MMIDASIATWNADTVTPSCSYLKHMNDGLLLRRRAAAG
jgi:hypothetical protein